MKNKRSIQASKLGFIFSSAAISIALFGYSVFYLVGNVGKLHTPLVSTGFGIPFVFSVFGKSLFGCNLKSSDCTLGVAVGFIIGLIVLGLIYYLIGYLLSKLINKLKKAH
jgi:uncharacterized membrane protein